MSANNFFFCGSSRFICSRLFEADDQFTSKWYALEAFWHPQNDGSMNEWMKTHRWIKKERKAADIEAMIITIETWKIKIHFCIWYCVLPFYAHRNIMLEKCMCASTVCTIEILFHQWWKHVIKMFFYSILIRNASRSRVFFHHTTYKNCNKITFVFLCFVSVVFDWIIKTEWKKCNKLSEKKRINMALLLIGLIDIS